MSATFTLNDILGDLKSVEVYAGGKLIMCLCSADNGRGIKVVSKEHLQLEDRTVQGGMTIVEITILP